ncbi:hypothetical protein JJD41_18840 [Oxynema sp. CENA135]|uniref:hypothetical protein n=1 Tax=Oxynema sp. CENA135 TaxID=984206 RepID=UPI00190A8613|nr:hypothetical protein [Oxynema sp. CENA135]
MQAKVKSFPKTKLPLLLNSAIVALALVGVVALQQLQLDRPPQSTLTPEQQQQQWGLRLQLLERTPTLDFDNVIADWTFLNFIQYFGDDPARLQTGYDLNDDYFKLITQLDPRFVEIYLFLSSAISFYQADPELSIQLMDRGTDALSPTMHPDAFLVWRYKGLDQLLLLGDIQGSVRSHEMAARWAQASGNTELAEIYRRTAEFLKTDPDSTRVRFWGWQEVYYTAIDRQRQQKAEEELLKLGAKKQVDSQGRVTFILPESE